MAEKLKEGKETKPVDPTKKKKALVISELLEDLNFVDRLPDKRKVVLYSDLISKFTISGKTVEVNAIKVKLVACEDKLKLEKTK